MKLEVDVGEPIAATRRFRCSPPRRLTDTKSTLFVVDGDTARAKTLVALGEGQGVLYVKPSDLPAGSRVVTQGRSLLKLMGTG